MLGDQIVDALEGKLDKELHELWKWPEIRPQQDGAGAGHVVTKDGSRSGKIGMVLRDELAKAE